MVPQSKGDVWPRKTTAALGSAPDDPVSRKNGRIADIVALISLRQAEMADFHRHLWQWSGRETVPRSRRNRQGSLRRPCGIGAAASRDVSDGPQLTGTTAT